MFSGLVTKVSLTDATEIIKYFSDLVIVVEFVWLTGVKLAPTLLLVKKLFKLLLKHDRQQENKGAERP